MGYEIDFLRPGNGNGDAICLRYGTADSGYSIHIVDGGFADTGQRMIEHINTYYNYPTVIDHVVLTHADQDHACGLVPILQHFYVGALWMNRPWLYAAEIIDSFHGNYSVDGLAKAIRSEYNVLVEIEAIAIENAIPIYETFAGARIGPFTVLAPSRQRYLDLIPEFDRTPASYATPLKGGLAKVLEVAKEAVWWFETWTDEQLSDNPPPTSASNESSVVQLAEFDDEKVVLTGDAGPAALAEAIAVAEYFGLMSNSTFPKFFQIPHHGSRRNVTPTVLNRWLGGSVPQGTKIGTAFCSVGSNKLDYPRHRVTNALLRRGYDVFPSSNHGWIWHHHEMPLRPGAVNLVSETFTTQYKE